MRVPLLPAASLALFIISPAFAQDMGAPWGGLYAGVNAGYGISGTDTRTTGQAASNVSTVADGARPGTVKSYVNGFAGGGQIGYNWQSDTLVFGIETDLQSAAIDDTRTIVTTGTAFPGVRNNQFAYDMDYFGTVRGRLGVASYNSLIYATGGLAYAGVNQSVNFSGPSPTSTLQFTGTNSGSETGYTVGAGVEYALGSTWSMKTEYLYYNLGSSMVAANVIPGSGGVGTGYDVQFKNMGHIFRVGLNFKLGY